MAKKMTVYILLVMAYGVLMDHLWQHTKKPDTKGWNFTYDMNQNDYTAIPERLELISYNKAYFKNFNVRTFKYNRTTPALNVTFTPNVKLGNEMELELQFYKFMSNEYRYFPIHFQVTFCKALKADMMGIREGTCGNFTDCPFYKGRVYHICNWTTNMAKLPPFMPDGSFMSEVKAYVGSTEIVFAKGYGSVTRPVPWQ